MTFYPAACTVNDTAGKALARELAPPEKIRAHYPKYLIAMDFVPLTAHNGIKPLHALEWLPVGIISKNLPSHAN